MYFSSLHRNLRIRGMFTAALDDMRRALGGEDQDGPDGGSPFIAKRRSPTGAPGADLS